MAESIIAIVKLEIEAEKFNRELNNFTNEKYNTFKNNINWVSGTEVSGIFPGLDRLYEKTARGYKNIDKWWKEYNTNTKALESSLVNCVANVPEGNINSAVAKLPSLDEYNSKTLVAKRLPNKFNVDMAESEVGLDNNVRTPKRSMLRDFFDVDAAARETGLDNNVGIPITSMFGDLFAFVKKMDESFEGYSKTLNTVFGVNITAEQLKEMYNAEAKRQIAERDRIRKMQNALLNGLETCGAVFATGFMIFGGELAVGFENFLDGLLNVGTTLATPFTAAYDLGQYIGGKISGNDDWESATKSMWEGTRAFVEPAHIDTAMGRFWTETEQGQYLRETVGEETFETMNSVLKPAARITFNITIGYAVGSPAAVAGLTELGRSSERAWSSGASTLEGITYGYANGIFEAAAYKIGQTGNLFGSAKNLSPAATEGMGRLTKLFLGGTKSKLLDAVTRIGFDGITGFGEGMITPLFECIYRDIDYKEAFEEAGGLKGSLLNGLFAVGFSSFFETIGVAKMFRDQDIDKINKKFDVDDVAIKNMDNATDTLSYQRFVGKESTLDRSLLFNVDQDTTGKYVKYIIKDKSFVDDPAFYEYLRRLGYDEAGTKHLIGQFREGKQFSKAGKNLVEEFYTNVYSNISTDQFFQRVEFDEFVRQKNILESRGLSAKEAARTLDLMNVKSGNCTYSSNAAMLFDMYKGNEIQFKKDFGFDMYTMIDGKRVLNSNELVLDMYLFANSNLNTNCSFVNRGSKKFNIDDTGRLSIVDPSGGTAKMNVMELEGYLKYKDAKISVESVTGAPLRFENASIDEVMRKIKKRIPDDGYATISVYGEGKVGGSKELGFYNPDGSLYGTTKTWGEAGGSHKMYITDIKDDMIEVISWGKKLYIKASDLSTNEIVIDAFKLINGTSPVTVAFAAKQGVATSDSFIRKSISDDTLLTFDKATAGIAGAAPIAPITAKEFKTFLGELDDNGRLLIDVTNPNSRFYQFKNGSVNDMTYAGLDILQNYRLKEFLTDTEIAKLFRFVQTYHSSLDPKSIRLDNWANSTLLNQMEQNYGKYIRPDMDATSKSSFIKERLRDKVNFFTEDEFKFVTAEADTMGVNNGVVSMVNVDAKVCDLDELEEILKKTNLTEEQLNEAAIKDIIFHESIHQVASNDALTKTGFHDVAGGQREGFNEAVTEYFTVKRPGSFYGATGVPLSSYGEFGVNIIDKMVKTGMISEDLLRKAYFTNDYQSLKNELGWGNDFYKGMITSSEVDKFINKIGAATISNSPMTRSISNSEIANIINKLRR